MFSFDSRRHHFDDGAALPYQMGEMDLTHNQRQLADQVPPYKGDADWSDTDFQFVDLGVRQPQAMG
ncbi:hypothetical protein [Acidovorax sp. BL-A-41-H1]|uniref:hypothetical protein n=1 Tax=Acidovorax sp. BL-A-41-H1 TaxID=3421102 RepID=UPI003F798E68